MGQSVRIIPLNLKGPRYAALRDRLRDGQQEAARVWNDSMGYHRDQRQAGNGWPNRNDLHQFTKGRYKLHSQAIQRTAYQLLANIDATIERRRKEPASRKWLKLPWREKRFMPLSWPAQAVKYNPDTRRMILPMGHGRKSIVLSGLDLDADRIGAVSIVWAHPGYELHIAAADPIAPPAPGMKKATIDLGIIHLATVADDAGNALVVSGRGIRAIKRHRDKKMRQMQRRQARCQKGSKRWRKVQAKKNRLRARARRQVRDLRHKATRQVIDWCVAQGVGEIYIGNPNGVHGGSGKKQNRRTSQWEYGTDIRYLSEKAGKAGIQSSNGDERGTSSHCPECRRRHKARGREWRCPGCGFRGHRDVVGAVNMHRLAYDSKVTFPRRSDVTYLRPGPLRKPRASASSIRPDTGPSGAIASTRTEAFFKPALSAPPDRGILGSSILRGAQAPCRVSG
ncbi:RNA-guided endonuclease InsQ/TnpB family protein [Paracoccus litorisediminis]|uniref:RNA-guided endonuclease InsQ/TnpB family protein n=1 Tax=Paracoccus litorisediminis TaxID=2006130 RepID=UPI00372DEE2E